MGRRVLRDGLRGRIPTLEPGHLPAVGRGGHDGGDHASLREGDAGVDRTPDDDPGHD
jgi:hypothetical protein